MSRAIRIHSTGGPEVLRFEEVDPGRPGPGQVLVRHSAIGVNFIDTYHRSGLYPLPSLPHGLGMEAAGRIEAVGDGVAEFRSGDRVAYATGPPGAYAEARVVAADRLIRLPDGIDDKVAAAALLRGLTVEYLIRRAFRVESGMTVLFHAAAGGVGLIACQWLRHLGATVIGTVGTDEKAALARDHGCTHVIVYSREGVAARVREITGGEGVPVVYDSVGRATLEESLGSLRRRGMLVSFGNASGAPPPIDPLTLLRKGSLFLTRPSLVDYAATRAELLAGAAAWFDVLQKRAVKVEVRRTWPLAEAAEAHRALESRQTSGSSILLP
jgi:NADPH2:quinone reductase